MVASATYAPYGHLGAYMKQGYVPVDNDDEAASKTAEYAFDDWTIARTAQEMGNSSVAPSLQSAPPSGATTSTPPTASSSHASRMAIIESRSIPPGPAPAAALPKAMPGNIPGTSRRMKKA